MKLNNKSNMKTRIEIIKEAKKLASYEKSLNRPLSEEQIFDAQDMIDDAITECQNWQGKAVENDTYSPFDKLARLLGRARM